MSGSNYKVFNGIHKYFADFMVLISNNQSEVEKYYLWLACGLLSYFVEKGHICIDLKEFAGRELYLDEENPVPIKCPSLETWMNALKKTDIIGVVDEHRPIILRDETLLYLSRYWQYERVFIEKIIRKLKVEPLDIDKHLVESVINRLFPEATDGEEDLQKMAVINGAKKNLLVISGGPGTGKTFTIAKIIALLVEIGSENLSIALAAPTGKAAARLKAMIKDLKEKINLPEHVKASIPEDTYTIHRLLGAFYKTRKFKYNEDNPLPHDVIIVDEASMVDLPLMSKLLEAIKDNTKLILVGDKDQLSSVEPGAVFGDICEALNEIPDTVVILKKNYRFGKNSGIGRLSELVKQGKGKEAMKLLREGRFENIRWRDIGSIDNLKAMIEEYIFGRYASYINASYVEEAFMHFDRFHVICSLRHGPFGVININGLIEKILLEKRIINPYKKWYKGKPIMITTNDYSLKLFNGDIGIVFEDPESKNVMRIYFKTEEGLRKIAPARIGEFETAYAITVHKSQGSEFDDIVFILSNMSSEFFTRELIYTAITRAKSSIEIWGTEQVFIEAVEKRIERKSGIRDALFFNQ